VSRFITYAIPLPPEAEAYVQVVSALSGWKAWEKLAERDPGMARYDTTAEARA
jgi:hypothetical protein